MLSNYVQLAGHYVAYDLLQLITLIFANVYALKDICLVWANVGKEESICPIQLVNIVVIDTCVRVCLLI